MERNDLIERLRREVLGCYFSTRGDLRHIAERAGFDFVPVEILYEGDYRALAVLRPKEVGEVRVHAVRPVPWQAFYITAIEPA